MNPDLPPREPPVPPRSNSLPRPGAFRYSAIELLAALGLLFLSAPLVQDLPGGDLVEAVLLTVVSVSAVLAVGGRRRTLVVALLLVMPTLVAKWANHFAPGLFSPLVYLVAATLFFGFVVAHLVRFVFRATTVDANVLCAGLSGYLLLGLLWVPAYVAIARLNPAAFTVPAGTSLDGFSAFYFSFITLSTVGYGDIAPLSRPARTLAAMEAIAGLFYVTILISRLVAIYSSPPPPVQQPPPDRQ